LKPVSSPGHGGRFFVLDELTEHQAEDCVARCRLGKGPTVRQQEGHTLLAASRVVPVYEEAEGIQARVLSERQPKRETARLDRNPAADGVEDHAERRAVQRVQGEPSSTPVPAARHSFAEQGDVRVVATENPLIDRLEQSPDPRGGGTRRRGPEALRRGHPGSLT
jgi:hypothetical protein